MQISPLMLASLTAARTVNSAIAASGGGSSADAAAPSASGIATTFDSTPVGSAPAPTDSRALTMSSSS